MENFDGALQIMILVIFGLTAILALLSIPDWIKISEWYKKKLFLALIIEVVAIVITYLAGMLTPSVNEVVQSDVSHKDRKLVPIFESYDHDIFVSDASTKDTIGKFTMKDLQTAGFFNAIDSTTALRDHVEIKWRKVNARWKNDRDSSQVNIPYIKDCPYIIKVSDYNYNTIYRIYNINDLQNPVFCSDRDRLGNLGFNSGERGVHLFEYKDSKGVIYYTLFRVTNARLKRGEEQFVNFVQIRIKAHLQNKA